MRVVSQSRDCSLDFDQTIFWTQYNVIYAKIGVESIAIGKYESDERAKEVFEDMHNMYSPYKLDYKNVSLEQIQSLLGLNLSVFAVPQIEKADIDCTELSNSIVYYMPEV